MDIDHRNYLELLSSEPPLKRKLSKTAIAKLAKGFRKAKSGEPANSGVQKKVGVQMIRAAARAAEKRTQKRKAG
jgi:hypothetical protein